MKSYKALPTHLELLNFHPNPECCLCGIALNDLINYSDKIVFIWMNNKKGCWFHISSVQKGYIEGYALIGSNWIYQKIYLSRIHAYY